MSSETRVKCLGKDRIEILRRDRCFGMARRNASSSSRRCRSVHPAYVGRIIVRTGRTARPRQRPCRETVWQGCSFRPGSWPLFHDAGSKHGGSGRATPGSRLPVGRPKPTAGMIRERENQQNRRSAWQVSAVSTAAAHLFSEQRKLLQGRIAGAADHIIPPCQRSVGSGRRRGRTARWLRTSRIRSQFMSWTMSSPCRGWRSPR